MAHESSFSTFLDATRGMRYIKSDQEKEAERQHLRPQVAEIDGIGLKLLLERSETPELSALREVTIEEMSKRVEKIGWAALKPQV